MPAAPSSAYTILLLGGLIVSGFIWWRLARREPRMLTIYVGGVLGAFSGAKLVYLLAEGWMFWESPDRWQILATGKTVVGALLGGYLGVEIAKRMIGYREPTGDWFALVAPIGISLGRVGCLLHGCCLGTECQPSWYAIRDSSGIQRWPSVPAELSFNLVVLGSFLMLRHGRLLSGQHFHLYLMSYGVFRFLHEFMRATPRIDGPFSGYHVAALACFGLGLGGFILRKRQQARAASSYVTKAMTTAALTGALTWFASGARADDSKQTILNGIREKHSVPGLAAAVYREGELVFSGVSGFRESGNPALVERDDLWHIGSCTKSMTATLAGILVDEGRIKWDARVADVLPEFRGKMAPGWEQTTLELLLANRGGAPNQAPPEAWKKAYEEKGSPVQQRLQFLRAVLAAKPEVQPGTQNIYSNQGFALAGAMLEKAAGKPYEDLIREKLFTPLGMKSPGFGAPGSPQKVDQPRGHTGTSSSFTPVRPGPGADNPIAIAPAGRVHCSIADLARYASWHSRGPLRDVKLMKDETFQRLHRPPEGQEYAMGWVVGQRDWAGGTVWNHNGSNTMWYAVIWVAPEKQLALVAACNAAGDAGAKACDEAIAMMLR